MCRLLGGLGKPRYLNEFAKVCKRDSKGKSHPHGWGAALLVRKNTLIVRKSLNPIWEDLNNVPRIDSAAFVLHARRGEKLEASLDHLHPHVCEGVVLAHNGNVRVPLALLKGKFARRTTSERLACLFGSLVRRVGLEGALAKLPRVIEPKPSANFIAIIPRLSSVVVFNYYVQDEYYMMWRKGDLFSSEPLGNNWEPVAEPGKPSYVILKPPSQ